MRRSRGQVQTTPGPAQGQGRHAPAPPSGAFLAWGKFHKNFMLEFVLKVAKP